MNVKNRKRMIFILVLLAFVVILAAVVPVSASCAKRKLVRLTMVNKSDQPAYIQLTGDEFYYLTVGSEATKTFTVNREVYDRITWTCDAQSSGTLDMSTNVKLILMPCDQCAPNQGAPTMEKVSLFDSPTGIYWRYQD